MTQAFLHSLNIGTLSAWLSVAGFGTVGVIIHPWQPEPAPPSESEETQIIPNEFDLGDAPFTPETGDPQSVTEPTADSPPEILPAPPELPPLAESEPLPEIPELPEPTASPAPAAENRARETPVRASSEATPRPSKPARSASGKPTTSSGGGSASGASTGSATTNAARLAAGRMPAPAYPAAARRGGQTGTVVVEFTVDTTGKVISAYAKSPSPWPLLNEEAVRTVRRWKFPPGGVMKLQRPIVFQLR